MRNANDDGRRLSAKQNQSDEVLGRGGQKLPGKSSLPGGGGAKERVPAKGNDITHEDDLLQTDISNELDEALDEDALDEDLDDEDELDDGDLDDEDEDDEDDDDIEEDADEDEDGNR